MREYAPGATPILTAGLVAFGVPAGAGGAHIGVPVVQEKSMPEGSSVSARCTWRGAVALPLKGVAAAAAASAASERERANTCRTFSDSCKIRSSSPTPSLPQLYVRPFYPFGVRLVDFCARAESN